MGRPERPGRRTGLYQQIYEAMQARPGQVVFGDDLVDEVGKSYPDINEARILQVLSSLTGPPSRPQMAVRFPGIVQGPVRGSYIYRPREAVVAPQEPVVRARVHPQSSLLAVSFDALTTPRDGDTLVNRWWVTVPEGALFYQHRNTRNGWTPQCNADEEFSRALQAKLYPGAEITFVPVAFVGYYSTEIGHTLGGIPEEACTKLTIGQEASHAR